MTFEYIVATVLLILLVLLGNPFMFWMPSMLTMCLLLIATLLVLVYAGFVLKEKGGDERELQHRMLAGRAAYLTGIGVLALALLVQGLSHQIDPWIPGALALMVLAKIVARIWSNKYL
jgi:hypothetical protein